jgi:AraC-like DNA-binding protein
VLANQPRTAIAIPIELLLLPIAKRQNVVPAARTTSAEISTVLTDVIMDMIRLNFSPCRFNMSTISSQLDLHPRRLQRLLKSERTSFRKIVGTIRLNEAKELLQHTELTVTEIALHLGYSDQANFWRAFVNATGLSPSEFRYQVSLETLT